MTGKILEKLHRRVVILPIAVVLGALVLFAAPQHSRFSFPLDDAWIHCIYADSFASGHGFQYNPGLQEAGSTSPFWSIVLAPAMWMGALGTAPLVVSAKAIGIACTLFALLFAFRIGAGITQSRLAAAAAATLFALEPRILYSALSGMENNLLIALWLGAAHTAARKRYLTASALLSLMPVTRPEAVLVFPFFLAAFLLNHPFRDESSASNAANADWVSPIQKYRKHIAALLIPCLPVCAWAIFCKTVTGHWLPNTFYVKAQPFRFDAAVLRTAMQLFDQNSIAPAWFLLAGILMFCLLCLKHPDPGRKHHLLTLCAAPLAYYIGVAGTRYIQTDGYYWTRWLDPAALILSLTACIGIAGIMARLANTAAAKTAGNGRVCKRPAIATISLPFIIVLAVSYGLPHFLESWKNRISRLETDGRSIDAINVAAGKWIHANTPPDAVVGVNDAGAIRFFGKRRTIDLWGLNNADIVFKRKTDAELFSESDYLAIFPAYFKGSKMFDYLEPVITFHIPVEDYTVCNCPENTTQVIYRKSDTKTF